MSTNSLRIAILSILFLSVVSGAKAQEQSEQLGEVTVVASRTVKTAEGYVTNLRGADFLKGKPAMDALAYLPSVSLESKALKINGFDVSEIYVNGIKLNDRSELDNIPAEMIEKVQVKYLSGVNQNTAQAGGSIWITLRRPPEGGFAGSVSGSATAMRRNGVGLESLSGVVSGRYGRVSFYEYVAPSWMQLKEWQDQSIEGPGSIVRMKEVTDNRTSSIANRFSLTYDFGDNTYLAGSYFISTALRKPVATTMLGESMSVIGQRNRILSQAGTLKLYSQLNENGTSLTATVDYYRRGDRNRRSYFSDGIDGLEQSYRNTTDLLQGDVDFNIPVHSRHSVHTGLSVKSISAKYRPGSQTGADAGMTADLPFDTKGLTPLVYASARGSVGQLRYSAGLNWQLNRIEYDPLEAGKRTRNTQWAINPTVQLMLPFGNNGKHSASLSYKHLLDNIPYSAISSLVTWEDAYNYSVGNPELKASTEHLVMAGVNLFNNLLGLTASYFYDRNAIAWETFQDQTNKDIFYTKPVNYDGAQSWALRAELNVKPVKQWRLKFISRFSLNPEDVTIGGVHYDKTRFRHIYILNNSLTFKHGWGGSINADLEPTYNYLDRTYHTVYSVDGKIYKTFMNNYLQFILDFKPISKRRRLDRRTNGQEVSLHYTNPEQYVGLTVRWYFRGGKNVKTNLTTGLQDYEEVKDTK